ncbi:hypothetical protein [Aeromicrobium sp.]|uniref:hypothetical protein n=1 Tax=Aeromicrobium sp. TaxID=1871063 RepID=UPI003C462D3A
MAPLWQRDGQIQGIAVLGCSVQPFAIGVTAETAGDHDDLTSSVRLMAIVLMFSTASFSGLMIHLRWRGFFREETDAPGRHSAQNGPPTEDLGKPQGRYCLGCVCIFSSTDLSVQRVLARNSEAAAGTISGCDQGCGQA